VASGHVEWSRLRTGAVQVGDSLAATLQRMIVDAEIAEGERLPPERELAAALGVSRASVRDALRRLELIGLVDRRPGRGTVVVDPHRSELSGDLLERLDVPVRTLKEVMDLRATLEPPIAARAAARATRADLRRLHEVQSALEAPHSLDAGIELDVRFHSEIARATHNPLLVRLVDIASEWFGASRGAALQTEKRRQAMLVAHRTILQAIEARDPDAAERAMMQYLVNGVMLGGIYGLMAVAFTLVYGVLGLVNFAFGEVFMFGAFGALFTMTGSAAIMDDAIAWPQGGFALAIGVGMVVGAIVGVLVERIVYRPLREAPVLTLLIASIAASLFLRSLGQLLFGANEQSFPNPVEGDSVGLLGTTVQRVDLLILVTGLATMAVLAVIVNRTAIGRGIRATAQDREAARLMGINTELVVVATFALGSMLAALSGVLYAAKYQFVEPTMGFVPALKALVAAVVGGIGNIPGAFIGGLLLGAVESVGAAYVPNGSAYRDVIAFLVLGLLLWLRPQGLIGPRLVERT
jgi:branched-chain amino acid transport system permease protein